MTRPICDQAGLATFEHKRTARQSASDRTKDTGFVHRTEPCPHCSGHHVRRTDRPAEERHGPRKPSFLRHLIGRPARVSGPGVQFAAACA